MKTLSCSWHHTNRFVCVWFLTIRVASSMAAHTLGGGVEHRRAVDHHPLRYKLHVAPGQNGVFSDTQGPCRSWFHFTGDGSSSPKGAHTRIQSKSNHFFSLPHVNPTYKWFGESATWYCPKAVRSLLTETGTIWNKKIYFRKFLCQEHAAAWWFLAILTFPLKCQRREMILEDTGIQDRWQVNCNY